MTAAVSPNGKSVVPVHIPEGIKKKNAVTNAVDQRFNAATLQIIFSYMMPLTVGYRMATDEFTLGASLQRTLKGTYQVLTAQTKGPSTTVTVDDAEGVVPSSTFNYNGSTPLRLGTQIARDEAGVFYFCSPAPNSGVGLPDADYFSYGTPSTWSHRLAIPNFGTDQVMSLLYDPLIGQPILMSEFDFYQGSKPAERFVIMQQCYPFVEALDSKTLLTAGQSLDKVHLGANPTLEPLFSDGSAESGFYNTHFLSDAPLGIDGFAIPPSRTRIFVSKLSLPHVFIYDFGRKNWQETDLGNLGVVDMSANETLLCQISLKRSALCTLWDVETQTEILNFQPWGDERPRSLRSGLGITTITVSNDRSVRIFDIRAHLNGKPASKQG